MIGDWEAVKEQVRARVCGACGLRAEGCETEPPGRCVLFDLFPLVAQAILATESRDLADYQRAIRENVCGACAEAALDLRCELRGQMRCALDMYLAEVVAAVREAAGRQQPSPQAVA
jgi:hypothetical protein